jgi:hypothetical protein
MGRVKTRAMVLGVVLALAIALVITIVVRGATADDEARQAGAGPTSTSPQAARGPAPTLGGCTAFPADNILNAPITSAALHPRSSAWVARLRSVDGAHGGVGAYTQPWQGSRGGLPINIGGVARDLVLDGSYGEPVARFSTSMPLAPRVEGEPNPQGAWDRHVLVVDPVTCQLTEHIQYRFDLRFNNWLTSGSVAWDLRTNDRSRPLVPGGVGAEAAGLPIAPLVYRYDEVTAGHVDHALRFAASSVAPSPPLWPAVGSDGRDAHPDAMPMGARLRLRKDTDLSQLGPQARVIARALQDYGMILADSTVSGWGLSGESDGRWNDADLGTLHTLDIDQFEVVDIANWQVSPRTMQARLPRKGNHTG